MTRTTWADTTKEQFNQERYDRDAMSKLMDRLTQFVIHIKARPVAQRLNQSLNFPIKATEVEKVLVILPRDLHLLDRASIFVQSLRKTYPGWRIELFDVDKLGESELNHVHLPKPNVIQKLKSAHYQFVLDLNEQFDHLTGFITLMTEAPYRLHIQNEGSFFYNIVYQPQSSDRGVYFEPLLNYLRKLFVKN